MDNINNINLPCGANCRINKVCSPKCLMLTPDGVSNLYDPHCNVYTAYIFIRVYVICLVISMMLHVHKCNCLLMNTVKIVCTCNGLW